MTRNYWLDLFTVDTWQEFLAHGGDVSGFSEARWATVKKIKPGDYLLCYLTRASRWVGVLEVTGEAFIDSSPIWKSQIFPSRVLVRTVVALEPEFGVPVLDMREELSVFQGLENPNRWSGPFRGSPARWRAADGDAVLAALVDARDNPVERPLGKLRKSASALGDAAQATFDGSVVAVPTEDDSSGEIVEGTTHTEVQYLLMKLGSDMGFEVHVAKNDLQKVWKHQKLGDMPKRRKQLPQQFDPATNRTIELIDVLWLQQNAIVAAFEIESTTSIFSGLLRMSDLVSMQPNIAIPLFLVAPEERRGQVVKHVNRPTFDRMSPPLVEVCRYISFDTLRESIEQASSLVKYLKPEWLQTISESCLPDDEE